MGTRYEDIKATLWKAAGTFRGTIDAANYKDFVLSIDHRTSGHGCPYCSGRKAITGKNDLATKYPMLLDEWMLFLINPSICA